MVFLTCALSTIKNWVKRPPASGNKYWKRKRVLMQSAHFYGRNRNCFSLAIRAVRHAYTNAQHGRKGHRSFMPVLWGYRIGAASTEHGIEYDCFMHNLAKAQVNLDKKVLGQLAWTEPRTFKSLSDIAKAFRAEYPAAKKDYYENVPDNVVTKGLFKNQ